MNILIFGPNGSGKGTLGAKIKEKYPVAHIESGAIFRENIKGGTELGKAAKAYIDRGDLVPDDITIPMILDRLQRDDCKGGWLLDGFPRNKVQAEKLDEALKAKGIKLDYVVEILLDRQTAKNRIMGRRLCANDNNILITSTLTQSSRTETSAVYAAEHSLQETMTRMRQLSQSAMTFTTTQRTEHWLLHTTSRTALQKTASSM